MEMKKSSIENLTATAQVFATLAIAYSEMAKGYSPPSTQRELYERRAEYSARKAVLVLEHADIWSVDALK